MIAQGDIWWADLGEQIGSAPGFRRPVVVVQGDAFNGGDIRTVVCVPLTANTRLAGFPGNLALSPERSGLPRPSVANVSALLTVDRGSLTERVQTLDRPTLERILAGIDIVLGR